MRFLSAFFPIKMGVLVGPIVKMAKKCHFWGFWGVFGGIWALLGGIGKRPKNGQKMSKKRQKMVKKCPV